jgi:hypothetical protein
MNVNLLGRPQIAGPGQERVLEHDWFGALKLSCRVELHVKFADLDMEINALGAGARQVAKA